MARGECEDAIQNVKDTTDDPVVCTHCQHELDRLVEDALLKWKDHGGHLHRIVCRKGAARKGNPQEAVCTAENFKNIIVALKVPLNVSAACLDWSDIQDAIELQGHMEC